MDLRTGTGAVRGDSSAALPGTELARELDPALGNPDTLQVGDLSCGGIACPFTAAPIAPCCTTLADVDAGSARAVDRCGIDLSATSSSGGAHCWQRDQGGVIDDECPAVLSIAGVEEPGCCTEQGRCGTYNSSFAVGCHYNAEVDKPCGGDDIIEEIVCEPTGHYALRVDVDVNWGGRAGGLAALTDDGRGPITIHLLARVEALGEGFEMIGDIRTCGVSLPPFFSSTLCESYAPLFPESIWESPELPDITLTGRFQCLNPGCVLTFDAQTVLLGISLDNPEAPWPDAMQTARLSCPEGSGERCFPDHDDDGYPGLTVQLRTGVRSRETSSASNCPDFSAEGAPLSASPAAIFDGVRRTDRLFLGTRTKLGGTGRIGLDCQRGEGPGIAEFVQSRGWGCLAQPGTANWPAPAAGSDDPCQSIEAEFMDQNLPIYRILAQGEAPDPALRLADGSESQGPVAQVMRIGDLGSVVSCTDVRAALP